MPAPMHIVEERVGDVTILRLKGRLELDDGDVLLRDHVDGLAAQGRVNIVLDMKEVVRMDSAGIGMLVAKFRTTQRHGGTMRLLHLTDRLSHLLHVTRLDTVFEIFDREDAAVQSFAAGH